MLYPSVYRGSQELRIVGLRFLLTVAVSVAWSDWDCDTALWWQPLSTKERKKKKRECLEEREKWTSSVHLQVFCSFFKSWIYFLKASHTFSLSLSTANKTNWKNNKFFNCEDICCWLLRYALFASDGCADACVSNWKIVSVAAVSAFICWRWAEECKSPTNVASELPQKSGRNLFVCQLFILFFEMEDCPRKEILQHAYSLLLSVV